MLCYSGKSFAQNFVEHMLKHLCATALLIVAMQNTAESQVNNQPLKQEITQFWEFRQAHKGDWKQVEIPSSVHTALLQHKMIEDPYYRDNEEKVQWIENEDWEYQTVFNVDDATLQKKHVELVFNGLDTYTHIYLNDSLILETDNMFREWRVDVKQFLKREKNRLHIYFESPLKKTKADWEALGYELPGGQRTMTRKAQFHYGWDWGPRLVGAGILKKPVLMAWDDFMFENVQFTYSTFSPEKVRMIVRFRYNASIPFEADVIVREGKTKILERRSIAAGVHTDTLWFDIDNPKLWWTRDLGEPHLYDFTIEVKNGVKSVDKQAVRTGIRKIELKTEKDAHGETFYFRLNGKPVFMRGANYIPQDLFQDRVTGQDYKKLMDDVVASNMNMLRVWGGGIYEDDIFYQLCDAKGILVWQDFMYACAMYPGGSTVRNKAKEALYQIERLRNHPSIALWCGNNENDEAWHNWGWQMKFSAAQRDQLWRDYKLLFRDVLGTYVNNEASGVPYWESSPRYGRYNPKSLTEGDNHYWGVWHDEEPFSAFDKKVPRFMSEYGFQSFPEWRTIQSFTLPEDRQLESKVMLAHQKHPRGNALIAEYTKRDFNKPGNFEDFVYVSQLVQAEGMRRGIEAHRRNKPYCMGTLYWQLNDVWPVASWSSIDCFGRWKAMQYYVRDVFAPVVALPYLEDNILKVYVANDKGEDQRVTVRVRAYDFDGKKLSEVVQPNTRAAADSSIVVWQGDLRNVLAKNKPESSVVEIVLLSEQERILSRRLFYAVSPKALRLGRAKITHTVEQVNEGYRIVLETNTLAKNVFIQTEAEGFFSDNYFDLLPGEKKEVFFKNEQILDTPAGAFKFKSL
jgi:beta-mannosidase